VTSSVANNDQWLQLKAKTAIQILTAAIAGKKVFLSVSAMSAPVNHVFIQRGLTMRTNRVKMGKNSLASLNF